MIENAEQAELLITALESAAVKLKKDPAKMTRQELEDLHDGISADRVMSEVRRTGEVYKWEDVKAELGL